MIKNDDQATHTLPFITKLIYGSGDWSMSSFNTIRQIFYAIFLTDTVGLRPQLASLAALTGIIWDAINDPLVGSISDNTQTKWGRRRPFLLLFSIPFGAAFILLWWAPPWNSQLILFIHITLAYMLADTLQTLVVVPFLSLTPELSQDYDERTSLTTFRMLFNLLASLAVAAGAPEIVASFANRQTGYLAMGAIFGSLSIFPYILIFLTTRERFSLAADNRFSPLESFTSTWRNRPFRIATLINLLNWVTFDLVALMLPFFIRYWIDQGNLQHQIYIAPIGNLTTESLVFLILLTTAILALPLWSFLAQRWNKRNAYITGMLFWAIVQFLILTITPGQLSYILILAIFAGISVSTAHVLPNALFPDILEWDEILTGQRRDGLYYGILNLTRKLASAFTIFAALQVLGLFGYQTPPASASSFTQSPQTLLAIRYLTGPIGGFLLIGAIVTAFFYPVSRETHARMRYLLAKRRDRQLSVTPIPPD